MATKKKLITGANFQDFDWNKAKLFYHLAKCGGFTKAAQLGGIDQSVLTRQIQILEKQVGCPLLVRKAGGITLTRKGEELLTEIEPFFLRMKGFCGHTYIEIDGEKKRKIRIVTTNAIAAYIIGDLMVSYQTNNPHLVFELIGEDHILDVILNDADIVIRPYDSQATGVQQEPLFTLEKKLYASKGYLEKYGEPKTVEDIKKHRLITTSLTNSKDYPFSDIQWILKLGMPEGKLHKPVFMSNSIECRINAAENGIGIIAGYDEMSIIRNSRLINIMPNIKDKETKEYFICPDYLKKDNEIINIKQYIIGKLKCKIKS